MMNLKSFALRGLACGVAVLLTANLVSCAHEEVRVPGSGPAAENPAAAGGGDVIPSIGGAGNGGGISGGGAGAGAGGQGAR